MRVLKVGLTALLAVVLLVGPGLVHQVHELSTEVVSYHGGSR